ncbi:hypothetical protein BU23DRAFT_304591 [Bimuria novae-zelandiae CBS 107.79]|uniref:Uncharacterized protein n=1 Tax=Bimuria novae-zelandiae CBS 107.79 TaxID=1447943 RepID=A0A6A5V130_9PLEO|nr:hypothetical protein BU23DRAFT_304591 [Bimuria novae-zelandiae CBS 107.79]
MGCLLALGRFVDRVSGHRKCWPSFGTAIIPNVYGWKGWDASSRLVYKAELELGSAIQCPSTCTLSVLSRMPIFDLQPCDPKETRGSNYACITSASFLVGNERGSGARKSTVQRTTVLGTLNCLLQVAAPLNFIAGHSFDLELVSI